MDLVFFFFDDDGVARFSNLMGMGVGFCTQSGCTRDNMPTMAEVYCLQK